MLPPLAMVIFVLVTVALLYGAGCLLVRIFAALGYIYRLPRRINKLLFRYYAGAPIIRT